MAEAPEDAGFMRLALGLARRSLGTVWPNPAVGCVIVAGGRTGERIVGRGWTQPGGRPHAETVALGRAGDAARGATAYVTLEPCAHHGRTPPCVDALIRAGVARVVIPMIDPDPRVEGRGVAALAAAGIRVDAGCLPEEAAALNRGFLTRILAGRPQITLKLAQSLDGRIATLAGESRWITGPLARRDVHLARAQADAVLVGAGTVRSDDPMLDVRGMGAMAQPVRVVVSGALAVPPEGRLGAGARTAPLWLCHHAGAPAARRAAWAATGAELIEVDRSADGSGVSLPDLARALGARGLNRVLCEGGGRLAAALIRDDLVDEIVSYSAGVLIGGDGIPAIGDLGAPPLAAAPRFRPGEARWIGPDVRTRWYRVRAGKP